MLYSSCKGCKCKKLNILRIATESHSSPAKKDGVIVACIGLDCKECDFGGIGNCVVHRFKWLCEDDGEEPDYCDGCKYEYKREDESPCTNCCNNYTSKFERRPKKTRQDEFLEHYPNAKKCKDILRICPDDVDVDYNVCESYLRCEECRRNYWLQEVEE